MSRLYAWIKSDMRKTTLTTRGNEHIEVTINYGSKYNSKLAVQIEVIYRENADKPIIKVRTEKLINHFITL